jgi:hypothetical protein
MRLSQFAINLSFKKRAASEKAASMQLGQRLRLLDFPIPSQRREADSETIPKL